MEKETRMKTRTIALATALAFAGLAGAAELAGVQVPDSATLAGQKLVLNGAGLRKKAIFKVYVGALYLPSKTSNADAALASGTAKVTMRFLRDVDADKLRGAWTEGFASNNAPADVAKHKADLDRFVALFSGVTEGQSIDVDFVAGTGVSVSIAGKARGTIAGDEFAKKVLRIWLGPKPPSDDLKAGMLGKG
jgi:hypothetical protein